MPTIATVTPNLRPGYDRNTLESLSNRRENVPLIVVVVGDRTIKIRRSCSKLSATCVKQSFDQLQAVPTGCTTNH